MKFSNETRIMMLETRIRKLSEHEAENYGLIQKAKRQIRKLQNS